jgi:signal transduction histidine kinase
VAVDVPEDLVLRSDPTAVETICLNLIDNALKYSDRPVRVRVMGRVVGRMAQITVADHGIGLSARDARRVFQRFFRADSEEVRRRSGTGLGLFVVAGLVRSLRGRVSATSPGVGRGTTITVQLPMGGLEDVSRPRQPPGAAPR